MNVALTAHQPRLRSAKRVITVGEFLVWLSLFFAAATKKESGRDLWRKVSTRPASLFSSAEGPNYGRLMKNYRFEDIKKVLLEGFSEIANVASDPWCPIRPYVESFNANRKRTIVDRNFVVVDESMSAFNPRTSATGCCPCHPKGLPHMSYIQRKPGNKYYLYYI